MNTSHMPYVGLVITLSIGFVIGALVSTSDSHRTRKEKIESILFRGAVAAFVFASVAHSIANSTSLGWKDPKTTQMHNVTISVLSKDEVVVITEDKSAITAKVSGNWIDWIDWINSIESGDYNEITVVRHEPSMFGYLYGLKPWTEIPEK